MVMPPEPAWCERHHWCAPDGDYRARCPKCHQENLDEKARWKALSLEEKVDELYKRIEEN